jgi:hypothetical protein
MPQSAVLGIQTVATPLVNLTANHGVVRKDFHAHIVIFVSGAALNQTADVNEEKQYDDRQGSVCQCRWKNFHLCNLPICHQMLNVYLIIV